jgi:dihydrolipoamide dehydrogenase
VATGAEAVIPPIRGLEETGYWTNRNATALSELPRSAAFIGGGVVSVELAQFMARFGVQCTVIGPSLAAREDPRVSERLAEILEEDGIELRIGPRAEAVRRDDADRVVSLDNGEEVRAEVVVVAVGRRPRTHGFGLENVGVEPGPRGIEVDDHCRAADGVWAIGDCTGGAFTHVAKYQARIAASDICGRPAKADYRAVPRVLFTEPEIASVGLTEEDARNQGIDVISAVIDLPTTVARPYTYEEHPKGSFGVIADRRRNVLVGAFALAPLAGEWIHQAVLAIRAEIPLSVLTDTIQQFPTFSEAFGLALRALPDEALMSVDHCAHPMIEQPLAEVK